MAVKQIVTSFSSVGNCRKQEVKKLIMGKALKMTERKSRSGEKKTMVAMLSFIDCPEGKN